MRTSGRKRPLSGNQHSFHETKRETLKSARPQVVTSRDSRLTDTSAEKEQVFSEEAATALAVKNAGTDKPTAEFQGWQAGFIQTAK